MGKNVSQKLIDAHLIVRAAIQQGNQVQVINKTKGETYIAEHALTRRQVEMTLCGSLLNLMRKRQGWLGHV